MLICIPSVFPKTKGENFNVEAAMSYVKDLADDAMEGRKSGQPGGKMAEDYIAAKFKEWGLEPAGQNGTYFQDFTFTHRNVEPGVSFQVVTEREQREFVYRNDWRVGSYSGSCAAKAEIVFIGFGIHAPDQDYDDYAGIEVKGKFVLFSTGHPKKLEKKAEDEIKIESRIKKARELGAKGALIFQSPSDTNRYFWLRLEQEIYDPDFVILTVEKDVTDFIFKDLKSELGFLSEEISKGKPQSLETGVFSSISVNAFYHEHQPARNVLAKITGIDKDLKNEYLILGAHMDHIGVFPSGEVMNGADDNASGTAVVMEIARTMKQNDERPKRTVVFALWAGEDQGLFGSKYYSNHPLFPMRKTVANLNIDMIGQGSGMVRFLGAYYGPLIWAVLEKNLPPEIQDFLKAAKQIDIGGSSDHASFLAKGIPGFFIDTDGYHFKYHQVRDEYDLIDPQLVKRTGDFVHNAAQILASAPDNFLPDRKQEMTYFKYRNIINFHLVPVDILMEKHAEENSDVDIQLAFISSDKGLSGEALRNHIIDRLLSLPERFKETPGLMRYAPSTRLYRSLQKGKTIVIFGLKGFDSFKDDPRWARVLASLGIRFVQVDGLPDFFDGQSLSTNGKSIVESLEKNNILLIVRGLKEDKAEILLNNTQKPFVLLMDRVPGQKVLDDVKKMDCSLGLVFEKGEDPADYFKRMNGLRKKIDAKHLMLVNETCLWSEQGKDQFLGLISLVLGEEDKKSDHYNIFTGAFIRLLK